MTRASLLALGVTLLAAPVAFWLAAQPIENPRAGADVVFVCRNGVAMSVWSAAYFNRLASTRGLLERAAARASIPSFTHVPQRMRLALALDGFRLDGYRPRVVSADDVRSAERVVAIDDVELPPDLAAGARTTEAWRGFPPMREDYFPSRRALKAKVEELIEQLVATAHLPTKNSDRSAKSMTGAQ